ncbi:hypothetical protein niasHT_037787 [Heterodera trifolii]|uniref:Uncharacterized protein n=1 Tax=Heterodera trifolii TaxID=157864 RepID=A0ABD2I0C9_9BILA
MVLFALLPAQLMLIVAAVCLVIITQCCGCGQKNTEEPQTPAEPQGAEASAKPTGQSAAPGGTSAAGGTSAVGQQPAEASKKSLAPAGTASTVPSAYAAPGAGDGYGHDIAEVSSACCRSVGTGHRLAEIGRRRSHVAEVSRRRSRVAEVSSACWRSVGTEHRLAEIGRRRNHVAEVSRRRNHVAEVGSWRSRVAEGLNNHRTAQEQDALQPASMMFINSDQKLF